KIARDSLDALRWLVTPRYWVRTGRALIGSLASSPLVSLGVAVLLLAALRLRGPVKRRLAQLAAQARAPTQTAIVPTLEAIGLCLAWAPWGPALLAYLGWRLSVSPEATLFVRSVAHGAVGAAAIWLTLEVPRQLVRRDGPAEAHFSWPAEAVASLRRQIGWIASLAVPLVLVIQ